PRVQVLIRKAGACCSPYLMLTAEPPTQPTFRVRVENPIRLADGAEAKVVRPAPELAVQTLDHVRDIAAGVSPFGFGADRCDHTPDTLLRRARAQVGPSRLDRVAPPEGVA